MEKEAFGRKVALMAMRKNVWTAWAVVSMSCCAVAGGVGFREAGGAHVAEGTQTLSGAFMVSPQGEFVKTGAGTLEIVPVGLWIIFR